MKVFFVTWLDWYPNRMREIQCSKEVQTEEQALEQFRKYYPDTCYHCNPKVSFIEVEEK